ncbi:peroxisomal N(1)-acetyl-spermine/spermidine oxidase-like [Dendrobates tinctorius]|uniref:peroxisomal N(1)-acetyl-spermine/spermidine oxidase-like n=1 Tax=Dendrobates tinctorius TaxID=92724 RepID=UPI003CC977CB
MTVTLIKALNGVDLDIETTTDHWNEETEAVEFTLETDGKGLIEVGAQWIHGPSPRNPVFQLASQFALLNPDALLEENQKINLHGHPPDMPFVFSSSGKTIKPENLITISELYNTWLDQARNFTSGDSDSEASVGHFIHQKIINSSHEWDKELLEMYMAYLRGLLNMECGAIGTHSMDHVALCPFGEYTMLPGLDCTFPKGYESLVNQIKSPLPNGTVILEKAVKSIHWDGSFHGDNSHVYPVKVQCEDGDSFVADHVVVPVPLGVLKKRVVDFFSPILPPGKLQAIKNLGFGTNNKILLEYAKPFWDPNTTLIQLVWEGDSPLTEANKDLKQNWMKMISIFVVLEPPKQLGHMLCGFIAGEESEFMETLTDEEVLSSMTDYFRKFTARIAVRRRGCSCPRLVRQCILPSLGEDSWRIRTGQDRVISHSAHRDQVTRGGEKIPAVQEEHPKMSGNVHKHLNKAQLEQHGEFLCHRMKQDHPTTDTKAALLPSLPQISPLTGRS